MKRSGGLLMPIVSALLILFVTVYMGFHIINAMRDPLKTVEAVEFSIEDTVQANGYFVRDEILIAKTGGVVRPSVENGARLAKGDVAFYVYRDQAALELDAELKGLEARIANMEYAQSQTTGIMDAAQMDRLIYARLTDMLNARDSRRKTLMSDQTVEFESLVFKREYTYNGGADISGTIAALKSEALDLRKRQTSAVSSIKAERSGAFTTEIDGYEGVLSMETLESMTLSGFDALGTMKNAGAAAENMGKQALGFSWGYIMDIPEDSSLLIKTGQKITLRFTDIYRTYVSFTVERIERENGRALVCLTTNANVSLFIDSRRLPSDVITQSHSGLRVPKEAIRLNMGKTGVYCLVGDRAVFKPVEIITERDNYYLVAFNAVTADAKGLLPADKMIVGGKDIYDGKVYAAN